MRKTHISAILASLPLLETIFLLRKLSSPELNDRRVKGLCFYCDDRFSPGHRSVTRKYLLMLADEPPPFPLESPLIDMDLPNPNP